jgi:hypothetical protein
MTSAVVANRIFEDRFIRDRCGALNSGALAFRGGSDGDHITADVDLLDRAHAGWACGDWEP